MHKRWFLGKHLDGESYFESYVSKELSVLLDFLLHNES
jgi:hypothetical protein